MGCGASTGVPEIDDTPTTGSEAAGISQRLIREHTATSEKITDTYVLDNREDWILGSGATSTVRKIKNINTGEYYALKTLQINRMEKAKLKELLQEVTMMKKLDHPNIIRIIETYRTHDKLHIVMELCTGGELFDKLYDQAASKFTEEDARKLIKKMTSALNYLHQAGIAHRDLKLENFIFTNKTDTAEIKLIDFGYSQNYLSNDHMSSIVGTAYYIAPEVLEGNYTKECDIWSMGVILFMMLSGRCPFGGETDKEIQEAVLGQALRFNQKHWSEISPDAIDLCQRMMERSVRKRLTCKGVLDHAWCTGKASKMEHTELDEALDEAEEKAFVHMKKFRKFNELKKTALMAIAFSLGDSQLETLRSMFQDLDKEKTGVLTIGEFKEALHAHSDMPDEEIIKIFESLDMDHTGVIKYTEFLAAAMQEQLYLAEDKILEAFNKLDLDHTGKITKENLRELLGEGTDEAALDRIITDADYHNNGYIDLEEFKKMMTEGEKQ